MNDQATPTAPGKDDGLSGVQLAVLHSRLDGIARKMANTLLRTGRSGVLNIARDFSCCIVTADHRLLVAADSLPIHVLSGPDLMSRAMLELHPDLKKGDAFLHNSPYHGNTHPADHTILVPVMDGQGSHRFTVMAKAHQADCGNALPTTYMGEAEDVYAEGALIFPAVQVQRDYQDIGDIIRLCEMRIRVPDQWRGDFLAMMGAARIGERELTALADEIGWDALDSFTESWLDYSEMMMREAIRAIPGGTATCVSTHDPVEGTPPEGIPVKAEVTVDPKAETITVDLTDNMDSLPCGLNLSQACAGTASMIGVFNSLGVQVPRNAGSFRRLDFRLREGCVVGIPRHPTSCSAATTNVADRVTNAVQAAFSEIADGYGLAETGAVMPPSAAVISGQDPRTKHPFVNQLFMGITGGAATGMTDAWMTILHAGNAGMCYQDSIELDELRHPLLVTERSLIPDSEGAGRFRGAPAVYVEYGPVDTTMRAVFVSDGAINAAKGVRGGEAGAKADQKKRGVEGTITQVEPVAAVRLADGERIMSFSAGGGGYGAPWTREVERVAHDVREGLVSRQKAKTVYRVVVGEDGSVDTAETDRLRQEAAASA